MKPSPLKKHACAIWPVFLLLSHLDIHQAAAGPFDAPPTYYNSATGTGSTLKSQLRTIMTSGHRQQTYGDFRNSASISDRDPNNPNNILLVYNRASVSGTWDGGGTWNREHLWPQSLQPGSASNGSANALSDPHSLRPSNPGINSTRGNDPFGLDDTSGSHRSVGSYYYPGDADRGDVARSMFYHDTRWSGNGISLTDNFPSSNQMGDLSSMIVWNYADAPDDFERRRNHAIYSSSFQELDGSTTTNPYYTNNRNAYVDMPWIVHSIYVDNANDTTLSVGGSVDGSGFSTVDVEIGRSYVNESVASLTAPVTLNKSGDDGTYFEITTSGGATSDLTGKYNNFAIGGPDSRVLNVGLGEVDASISGLKSGAITVNNLDITAGGAAGDGANDADDLINLSLAVLDHPVPSFSPTEVLSTATIDFGQVTQGSIPTPIPFAIDNYAGAGAPTFASMLDLDSTLGMGDTGAFFTNLVSFEDLVQGDSLGFIAGIDASAMGAFSATYTLNLSGEDLPGEQQQMLTLTLVGEVIGSVLLQGDANGDGSVDILDLDILSGNFGTMGGATVATGDFNADGNVDILDLDILSGNFGAMSSVAIPEPTSLVLLFLAAADVARRRIH